MHVDAARDDVLAGGVDALRAGGLQAPPDHRDLLAVDQHVALVRVGGGHDRAVRDERLPHFGLPSLGARMLAPTDGRLRVCAGVPPIPRSRRPATPAAAPWPSRWEGRSNGPFRSSG